MIKQPYGPLLGGMDCESSKDFAQYYRNRYFAAAPELFGLSYPNSPGLLFTCGYYANEGGVLHIYYFNTITDSRELGRVSWEDLTKYGRFGHPLLGTIPHGPTYAYGMQTAVRESSKGLSTGRITWHIPQYMEDDVFRAYAKKHSDFYGIMNASHFCQSDEMKFISKIYNKEMFTWEEAIKDLQKGKRLGCNISNRAGIHFAEGEETILFSYRNQVVGKVAETQGRQEVILNPWCSFLQQVIKDQVPKSVGVW